MLLRHSLNLEKEAAAIEAAVNAVLDQGHRTKDIAAGGPSIGTEEMGTRVVEAWKSLNCPSCIPKQSHTIRESKGTNVVKASHVLGGCLIAAVAMLGGCSSTTRRPPKVIGVRKDAQGKVVQEFVYQDVIVKGAYFPGPHGFTSSVEQSWSECVLREPGKADLPLPVPARPLD